MRRLVASGIIMSLAVFSVIVLTSSAESDDSPEITIEFGFNYEMVNNVCFSPDSKLLFTNVMHQGVSQGYTASLWSWKEKRKISELKGDMAGRSCFISESELVTIRSGLWLIKDIQQRPTAVPLAADPANAKPGPDRIYYTCVALSPCQTLCAAGRNDGIIEIWDLRAKKKLHALEQETWVMSLVFSEDGSHLVSVGRGEKLTGLVPRDPGIRLIGEVVVWDCRHDFRQLGAFRDTETAYHDVGIYNKGDTAAVLGFKIIRLTIKNERGDEANTTADIPVLSTFSLPKATRLRESKLWPNVPKAYRIHGELEVSPDKKLLAIALSGGYLHPDILRGVVYNEVLLFELPNLRELVRMRKGSYMPRTLAFSPDGKYLAISYTREWDLLGRPFVDIWLVERLLKTQGK